MQTMRLGRTNLEVFRIGFGGIPIGRLTEDGAIEVIRHALDRGINFIDTAVGYENSEERIGKALAGRREQVVIATKTPKRDGATALKDLAQSLERFQTDYIDIWQLHNVGTFEEYERALEPGGALEAAQDALRAGKIRHIGISSHAMNVALEAVKSGHFETIQYPFNFVNDEAADELIPLALAHDVGFIAMKPFAGGQLKSASLVIKYLLQFDGVVPDPGIQKIEEVDEIIDIVNGTWELTSRDLEKMDEIRASLGTKFCHWCGYCMPCPQGVDIPWLMNARTVESYAKGFFRQVEEAVQTGQHCIECGECEEKCPFHLPIREMIVDNIEYFEGLAQGA